MAAKIARFNSVNSEITGRKLTIFGKKSTEPLSVIKELSYREKIAKIGPVYPEIFDKIRQFFCRVGKKSTEPLSVIKELSYREKIAKIGPVYPEIFDKIRQFFCRVVPDVHK